MTVSNYNQLAKMVSKQRLKVAHEVEPESKSTTDGASNSFHSKQKMLESRIEKLRSLENQIQ